VWFRATSSYVRVKAVLIGKGIQDGWMPFYRFGQAFYW
jgi:hypothetical protein